MDTATARQRPTGVTVIAILAIVFGALGICGSLALLGIGGTALGAGVDAGTGGLAMGFGGFSLIISILDLVFGIGAWMLKPWAWMLGLALMGLSILSNIVQLIAGYANVVTAIIGIAIAAIIIYYLMTPGVKAAFGRS